MKSTYNTHCEVQVRFISKAGEPYTLWVVRPVEPMVGMGKDRRPPHRCPSVAGGCGAPINLHKASSSTASHFEHVARNPGCRFSDIYEGRIVDIDWSQFKDPERK